MRRPDAMTAAIGIGHGLLLGACLWALLAGAVFVGKHYVEGWRASGAARAALGAHP